MEIRQSVLVPYAAEDMFDLIEQAEAYPSFVPWCTAATILERSDEWVAARLEFSYLKIRFAFATRNPKQRPHRLQVRLVDGPFRHFVGNWTLTPLGGLGCKVAFELSYEIGDRLIGAVALPAAELVSRAMVDAFVRRARATLKELEPAQTPAPPKVQADVAGSTAPAPPREES